jgi:hypothetical protein
MHKHLVVSKLWTLEAVLVPEGARVRPLRREQVVAPQGVSDGPKSTWCR